MEITGRRQGPKRIGELLVAANVIRQEVLLEALKVSKNSQTPLGRVLMSIGELSERDLDAAISVQQLIRQGAISNEFGIKAINVSIKGKIALDEAFKRLGWTPPEVIENHNAGELGELLVAAGLVERTILEQAIWQSQENSLPLGRCLVLNRALTSTLLQSALTAQVLIRDGKITFEQAINSLKNVSKKQTSLEQSLFDTGAFRPLGRDNIKFGDLLTQAGIVTEGDKISAIEIGLAENQKIGEVFIQSGMVPATVVDESLRLQNMVNEGQLSGLQAAEILRQAHSRGITIDAVMEERSSRQDEVEKVNTVLELLMQSGVLTGDDFNRAQSLGRQLNVSIAEVILTKEMVSKKLIAAALQGQSLVAEGMLKQSQCATALKMCARTGSELHEVLKDLPPEAAAITSTSPPSNDDNGRKAGFLGNIWSKLKKD
ncbi:MAG: hypothetical protein KGS72_09135 [Cyanobacteria bacterium REEB67]|nr:hypothetical protein [Cyanobacteria bacterium REEB67]